MGRGAGALVDHFAGFGSNAVLTPKPLKDKLNCSHTGGWPVSKTLTRADLSEAVHRQVGLSRSDSADLVKSVLDAMADAVATGENVKLSSFGTFIVREKRPRMGRNPKTGVEVLITKRRVLVFRPSQVMKNRVNGLANGGEAD
jgi:integration host factor subunit alpha